MALSDEAIEAAVANAPAAPVVQWSPELTLDHAEMDAVHEEFVALLAQAAKAADDELAGRWASVMRHTEAHFAAEEAWMQASNFEACGCHSNEHQTILAVMREGGKRGLSGHPGLLRQLARELGVWFAGHAQGMDAALAAHLKTKAGSATAQT
jgi:hemerythrin-like metal-binding protein